MRIRNASHTTQAAAIATRVIVREVLPNARPPDTPKLAGESSPISDISSVPSISAAVSAPDATAVCVRRDGTRDLIHLTASR